eukprot:TRINITY_DN3078_c1_g2_i11.p1 TRINITY_DN3078_c1_g2~~TRINITY_DN3078_c1_g2_i11.p1  ORF type:complete len:111 (+),score=25.47 TRINITY_DN3078_c1_g2_i11:467-799(+)
MWLLSYLTKFTICGFSMVQGKEKVVVRYALNEKEYQFEVPAISDNLRCVFVSCNGFHEEEPSPPPRPKFHKRSSNTTSELGRYHLIIQGGDQVYAVPGSDSILPIIPNLN